MCQPFERFPAEVQPVEVRIGGLQPGHDADGVRIVVEPARVGQRGAQRVLARMTERRMAKVVREAQRLGQILVEAECAGDGAANLRDFEAVGQPHAIMVAVGSDEHLGLLAQAAETDRMDDPVAVALENVTRAARTRVRFGMKAAARLGRLRGDRFGKLHSVAIGTIVSEGELVQRNALIPSDRRSSAKVWASEELRNGPISRRARSELCAR